VYSNNIGLPWTTAERSSAPPSIKQNAPFGAFCFLSPYPIGFFRQPFLIGVKYFAVGCKAVDDVLLQNELRAALTFASPS